jgi:small-conductance mechanosensitive channel
MREDVYLRVGVLAGVVLLAVLLRLVARHIIKRRLPEDDQRRYTVNKIMAGVFWALLLLGGAFAVAGGGVGVGAILGLGTLGVAYALQDIISSVAGWFVAVGGGGYGMGDRIRIGDLCGDVVDIALIRTWLMEVNPTNGSGQSTGCLVSFPNNILLRQPLHNFTTGTRSLWQELTFTITYESDWQAAEQILLEATREINTEELVGQAKEEIRRMVGRFRVRFGTLTPIVYVWPAEYGLELTLRHLTEARRQRTHRDVIARYVIRRFSEHPRIQFAYPTQRLIPTPPLPAATSDTLEARGEPEPNADAP